MQSLCPYSAWLLKILARNISYLWGMCICYVWLVDKWIWMLLHQFAIQSLCGLKQSWKSASQSSEWSPNSLERLIDFRRYLVSHCPLILTLPPSLACPALTHTWHSIHRGQLAVLPGTLCSSMSLLSPHVLHYACHALACGFFFFFLTMKVMWPLWTPTVEPYVGILTFSPLGFILLLDFYTTLKWFPCQFLIGFCMVFKEADHKLLTSFSCSVCRHRSQLLKPRNFMLVFVLHTPAFSYFILQQLVRLVNHTNSSWRNSDSEWLWDCLWWLVSVVTLTHL